MVWQVCIDCDGDRLRFVAPPLGGRHRLPGDPNTPSEREHRASRRRGHSRRLACRRARRPLDRRERQHGILHHARECRSEGRGRREARVHPSRVFQTCQLERGGGSENDVVEF